jgi:hypothetical protein
MKTTISSITLLIILCLAGCSFSTKSTDLMLNTASLQIDSAQKAEAEQFASVEFDEAKTLYQSALSAPNGKQKSVLAERANAKARLAESVAKQVKAEQEADKLETELKIIEEKASKVQLERQTAEEEFNQFKQGDNQ